MLPAPKTDFTPLQLEIAALAKAISHPARIAILDMLAQKNECICGDMVEVLPLAQATISQHLKILKLAGLIRGTVSGPKTCYCLNTEGVEKMKALFSGHFNTLQIGQPATCC